MAYSAPQAARLTGCTPSQLAYWERTGLVAPEDGTYGFRDLVALRVVASLLEAGLTLTRVRQAVRYLLATGEDIAGLRLVTDGDRVWACRDDGQILDALRRSLVAVGEVRRHVLHQPAQHGWRGGGGRCRPRRCRLRGGAGRRQDRPGGDQSPSTHSTLAPRRVMFSANCGCARRTGVALRMTDLPGMLAATISSAIATRMM